MRIFIVYFLTSEPACVNLKMLSIKRSTSCPSWSLKYSATVRPVKATRARAPVQTHIHVYGNDRVYSYIHVYFTVHVLYCVMLSLHREERVYPYIVYCLHYIGRKRYTLILCLVLVHVHVHVHGQERVFLVFIKLLHVHVHENSCAKRASKRHERIYPYTPSYLCIGGKMYSVTLPCLHYTGRRECSTCTPTFFPAHYN